MTKVKKIKNILHLLPNLQYLANTETQLVLPADNFFRLSLSCSLYPDISEFLLLIQPSTCLLSLSVCQSTLNTKELTQAHTVTLG